MATPAPPIGEVELPPVAAKTPDPETERLKGQLAQSNQQLRDMQQALLRTQQPQQQPNGRVAPPDAKEFFKQPWENTAEVAHNVATAVTRQAMSELGGAFGTLVEVARNNVRAEDPEIFDKYELEIKAKVAATPQQFHSQSGTWRIAFNAVKGEHMRELISAARPDPVAPAVHVSREGGPASPSPRSPNPPKEEKLSDDERKWARNLGLSEAQYRSGKDHYNNQSDKGPSSWDSQITFSSRDKRRAAREQRSKQPK